MAKTWDVKRPAGSLNLSNERLITELYHRGVTIERIFSIYYTLEEIANHGDDELFGDDEAGQHGRLTVGDIERAGLTKLPAKPHPRQPF